jgi:hypothetical protein
MATEKQFQYFKSLYDEENAREEWLAQLAKTYLSLVTLYSAFVFFVAEARYRCKHTDLFATVAAMALSFLLSLWSAKVSEYEAPSDPQEIIEEFGDSPPTDEDFFDERIIDFAVAYTRNSEVNDRKANQLTVAGYAILAGIVLQATYMAIRIVWG